ncbi:MAG: hypothetical protein ACYS3S_12770, partial [Planctomycetota bacterium]
MECVHELARVGSPGSRSEVHVPIHLFSWPFGLGREHAAHLCPQATGVGVQCMKWTELACPGQLDCIGEVGQAATLRAGLEDAGCTAKDIRELQALGDVFRTRLFTVNVFACLSRHR